jgi:hypothetical protein
MKAIGLLVVVCLALASVVAAQTYRSRATRVEWRSGERLRLGPPFGRALVFPCAPIVSEQRCAADVLEAGRVEFEGTPASWRGFQLCRPSDAGEVCVSLDQAFASHEAQ